MQVYSTVYPLFIVFFNVLTLLFDVVSLIPFGRLCWWKFLMGGRTVCLFLWHDHSQISGGPHQYSSASGPNYVESRESPRARSSPVLSFCNDIIVVCPEPLRGAVSPLPHPTATRPSVKSCSISALCRIKHSHSPLRAMSVIDGCIAGPKWTDSAGAAGAASRTNLSLICLHRATRQVVVWISIANFSQQLNMKSRLYRLPAVFVLYYLFSYLVLTPCNNTSSTCNMFVGSNIMCNTVILNLQLNKYNFIFYIYSVD